MRFKIPGLRRAGVAAIAALTAGTAFATLAATPASAVIGQPDGADTSPIVAASQPTIVAGSNNQAAGNWVISDFPGANSQGVIIGDSFTLDLAPNSTAECTTNTDYVGFAGTPTVTITANTVGDTPPLVTTVVQTDPAVNAVDTACAAIPAANGGPVHNQLKVTVNTLGSVASTSDDFTVTISNVTMISGNSTPVGAIIVTNPSGNLTIGPEAGGEETGSAAETDDPNPGFGASNATVSAISVTANKPPVGLKPITASQAISNIVITESETAAVATGQVCIEIEPPAGAGTRTTWDPTSTPTVTATNGGIVNNGSGGPNGSSSGVTLSNSTSNPIDLTFNVFAVTSSPGTYTISGLKVNTGTATGPLLVTVDVAGNGCGNAGTKNNLEIAAIIAVNRIGGADRYGTAAALFSGFARACTGSSGLNAVLARGDLFADALAANYLAGALHQGADEKPQGSGIVLTTPTALPDVTLAALRAAGVTDVFIAGQTMAVSQAVEDQLKATPAYVCGGTNQRVDANGNPLFLKVTRIGGATRYDTAQLIGQFATSSLIGTADIASETVPHPLKTAILARGDNFPDALAAGPMAFYGSNAPNYSDDCDSEDPVCNNNNNTWGSGLGSAADGAAQAVGFPLFLTTPGSLSPQAQAGLLNDGVQQVIVMGGSAAIASSVDTTLQGLGLRVVRLAGTDRSDTARLAANLETGTFADVPNAAGGFTECDSDGTASSLVDPQSCTKPAGLFYRTDIVNVARGDDAGGGADALAGGPFAAGLVGANENNPKEINRNCCGTGQEGPTPILLTLDPNTLGAAATYLGANSSSVTNPDPFGPEPGGGITIANVFGQTAAISAATATAVQNALT